LPPARRAGVATFLSESLRLAKERGANTTLDDEFGRDLETVVVRRRSRSAISVLTVNARHFGRIPGLPVIQI